MPRGSIYEKQDTEFLLKEVKLLEGPLSCLAADTTVSHLVVGGRNVFKIFNCQKQNFEEVANLRCGISATNLHLSVNDVQWCHLDDRILVSASNHGSVVVWDMASIGQPRQQYLFEESRRTVNSLEFHASDPFLVLAASQDGSCKLLDLRAQRMTTIYGTRTESAAREVQFNPRNPYQFGVVFENGTAELWDIRNHQRCERQWIAHNGPCVCLNWHPEENWLATGGRDKIAAIWDFSNPAVTKVDYKYSAETVASVGRVKWRPQNKYQILTTAMLTESNVSIWDIRRPYVPDVFFVEHKDAIGGVIWKDQDYFYTCGRDNRLCRFVYSNNAHLRDGLNPVAVSISLNGSVLSSTCEKLLDNNIKYGAVKHKSSYKLPSIFQRGSDKNDQTLQQSDDAGKMLTQNSVVTEYIVNSPPLEDSFSQSLSTRAFVEMAENYKLNGASVSELCDFNANVANNVGKPQIATTWNMLKFIFAATEATSGDAASKRLSRGESKPQVVATTKESSKSLQEDGVKNNNNKTTDVSTTGISDYDSDNQDEFALISNHLYNFTEFEKPTSIFDSLQFESNRDDQDWTLPNEAFVPADDLDLQFGPDPLVYMPMYDLSVYNTTHDDSESPATECSGSTQIQRRRIEMDEVIKQEILNTTPFAMSIPVFDYIPIVIEMLHFYANQNDVQTIVSVTLTLGNRILQHLDTKTFGVWLMSYIDQLNDFKLYMKATDVFNLYAPLSPQMSTQFKVSCSRCSKSVKPGWLCRKCVESNARSYIHKCTICHLPVKSLFIWCQGCSHGGHLDHIIDWFSNHKECPTGCGHLCEYT